MCNIYIYIVKKCVSYIYILVCEITFARVFIYIYVSASLASCPSRCHYFRPIVARVTSCYLISFVSVIYMFHVAYAPLVAV